MSDDPTRALAAQGEPMAGRDFDIDGFAWDDPRIPADTPATAAAPQQWARSGCTRWMAAMTDGTAFERPCAEFALCAAYGCGQDAVTELHHTPGDGSHWVPLCADHRAATFRGSPIEYVIECHGFVPGPLRDAPGDNRPPEPVAAPESLRASVLWVIFTALTWTAVLIAATFPRWDTTLAACAICFARGRWNRDR
jgi:hypothetical protein